MQKRKRKKKLRNKKDSQIFHPVKHEKFGNLNNYSEDIVKEIIEKIISLTITQVIRKRIDSKINKICFETIQRFLNLTVSLTNINHDRDNIYNIENIWEEKNRPNSDEKRYKMKNHKKCNKIRHKKAEDDLFDFTDINRDFEAEMNLKDKDIEDYLNKSFNFESIIDKKKLSKTNFWGNISEPKTFSPQRIASKSNTLIKNVFFNKHDSINDNKIPLDNIKSDKDTPKKKGNISSTILKSRKQSKSRIIDELSLRKSEEKKLFEIRQRKFLLLDMEDMKEIEEKKTRQEEPQEIKELRRLKLEEIQLLKEEEEKSKVAQKLMSQNDSNFEYDLDSINLTALERSKNVQTQRKLIEDQIRKGNFTYDFNNRMILIRRLRPDAFIDDFPSAITKSKEREKEKEKANLLKSSFNKKKSDDISMEKDILNDQLKKKDIIEEKNYVSNYFNYNFNFNLKVTPCGSNFQKIRPAIGVNIYEGDEMKTGGKEFFEKFKKFSLKDYDKMLKDIIKQQKDMNKSFKEKSNEKENKNVDNLDIKKNEINGSVDVSAVKNNFGILNQRIQNIRLNASKDKHFMNKSQSQLFTINKKNLYNHLLVREDTKEIPTNKKNEDNYEDILNKNNLFLKRLKKIIALKKRDSQSYQLVDSFNKSIIIREKNNGRNLEREKEKIKNAHKLPIIPLKSNKSVIFSRKEQFLRTRMKKIIED